MNFEELRQHLLNAKDFPVAPLDWVLDLYKKAAELAASQGSEYVYVQHILEELLNSGDSRIKWKQVEHDGYTINYDDNARAILARMSELRRALKDAVSQIGQTKVGDTISFEKVKFPKHIVAIFSDAKANNSSIKTPEHLLYYLRFEPSNTLNGKAVKKKKGKAQVSPDKGLEILDIAKYTKEQIKDLVGAACFKKLKITTTVRSMRQQL